MGEGAHRAGQLRHRDLRPSRHQPCAVAGKLGIMPGQFQPERGRLGMDAVAAADGQGELVLERPRLQRRQHRVEVRQQQVGRLGELHRQAGVQHVGAGHSLVHEAAVRPDRIGQPGRGRRSRRGGFHARSRRCGRCRPARSAFRAAPPCSRMVRAAEAGIRPIPRHALGGQRLDLEPDAVAILGRPDGVHLGSGITGNHRCHVPPCRCDASYTRGPAVGNRRPAAVAPVLIRLPHGSNQRCETA